MSTHFCEKYLLTHGADVCESERMDINTTIPDIEARLKKAGVGIDDFCRSVGVNRSTWQRWKAGENSPKLDTWKKVLVTAQEQGK